jgi:hypothetical protein
LIFGSGSGTGTGFYLGFFLGVEEPDLESDSQFHLGVESDSGFHLRMESDSGFHLCVKPNQKTNTFGGEKKFEIKKV